MGTLTASQLNTFSDEIMLNSQKIRDNASHLVDTSRLIGNVIQCGDVSERIAESIRNVSTSLDDVSDQMNKVGISVREAAELQKNRDILGV